MTPFSLMYINRKSQMTVETPSKARPEMVKQLQISIYARVSQPVCRQIFPYFAYSFFRKKTLFLSNLQIF